MNIRSKVYGGGDGAASGGPVLHSKKPRGAKADALNSVAV